MWADGQTDTTKLTAALRTFAKAPQNRVAGKIKYRHPEEFVSALSLSLSLSLCKEIRVILAKLFINRVPVKRTPHTHKKHIWKVLYKPRY